MKNSLKGRVSIFCPHCQKKSQKSLAGLLPTNQIKCATCGQEFTLELKQITEAIQAQEAQQKRALQASAAALNQSFKIKM